MSEIMWGVYQLFHSPPGTPQELKCVGCKVAAGTTAIGLAGASLYGAKRTMHKNIYTAMLFGGLAFGLISGSVVAFRLAYDHTHENKLLIKRFAEENRKQRLEQKVGSPSGIQEHS